MLIYTIKKMEACIPWLVNKTIEILQQTQKHKVYSYRQLDYIMESTRKIKIKAEY